MHPIVAILCVFLVVLIFHWGRSFVRGALFLGGLQGTWVTNDGYVNTAWTIGPFTPASSDWVAQGQVQVQQQPPTPATFVIRSSAMQIGYPFSLRMQSTGSSLAANGTVFRGPNGGLAMMVGNRTFVKSLL